MPTLKSKSKKPRKAKAEREKKPFPKPQPPVRSSAPFAPTKPVVMLSKKQVCAKLGNISEVTLWDRIRTGQFPMGSPMGNPNGKLWWIEEEVDNSVTETVNACRRPSGSTVTP
jgi:predicted DNA-binding transcriptional regulator AlpA